MRISHEARTVIYHDSAEDDQSILIEMSSCNLQFFSELITTQLRDFHMVSPLLITMFRDFMTFYKSVLFWKEEK